MIVTISGAHGSGKSTIAQMLADKLSWPRYYMGGLRREAAKQRGLTLAEYNLLGENDPATDKEVDEYQQKLGLSSDSFIIEGRTSWFFIPHSFKIYLDVSEEEGYKRIFSHLQQDNDRNEDKNLLSPDDVRQSLRARLNSDRLRYFKYYGIDVNDRAHYDYCLDTTHLNPSEAFEKVYQAVISAQERFDANLDSSKNKL